MDGEVSPHLNDQLLKAFFYKYYADEEIRIPPAQLWQSYVRSNKYTIDPQSRTSKNYTQTQVALVRKASEI